MISFFKRVPSISVVQLQKELEKKIFLIDVRTPLEYQSSHITVAKNIPLNKIDDFKQNNNEKIFVICQSGMRSKKAARVLINNGYNVVNVKGGMSKWTGKIKGGR